MSVDQSVGIKIRMQGAVYYCVHLVVVGSLLGSVTGLMIGSCPDLTANSMNIEFRSSSLVASA